MSICILDRACVYRNVFMPAYCKSRPYSIMLGLTCAVIFEGGILRKKYFGTLNSALTKSSMIASTLPSVKCFMQALSASLLAVWLYVLAILIQLSPEHCVSQHERRAIKSIRYFSSSSTSFIQISAPYLISGAPHCQDVSPQGVFNSTSCFHYQKEMNWRDNKKIFSFESFMKQLP